MYYALTVELCIKPHMEKTLRSSVQNARANKDYDTSDISPYQAYVAIGVCYTRHYDTVLTSPAIYGILKV
jgi:ribosomal protein L22